MTSRGNEAASPNTPNDNRLKKFAAFFKGYMGVMPLVTAAFAPVLTLAHAIPVFESQRTSLATISGLIGFLLVAWLFSARSVIVPIMANRFDPSGMLPLDTLPPRARFVAYMGRYGYRAIAMITPLLLIGLSSFCYFYYLQRMDRVLDSMQQQNLAVNHRTTSRIQLLQDGAVFSLHDGTLLEVLYVGIFINAEAAFVTMALREYGYSELKIKEEEIMSGRWAKSVERRDSKPERK